MEHAAVPSHVQQSVRFPMAVSELSDHVTCNFRAAAHRFDLIFESPILLPLSSGNKIFEIAKDPIKAPVNEPILHAVRIHDSFAPIVAGLEPPGLLAVGIEQLLGIRKAPVPELRADKRLLTAGLSISLPTEQPLRARCETGDESVPISPAIRDGSVEVIIRQVGANMETWRQG